MKGNFRKYILFALHYFKYKEIHIIIHLIIDMYRVFVVNIDVYFNDAVLSQVERP